MVTSLHPQRREPPCLPDPEEVMRRARGENFRVVSRLLPPAARRHLLAFYGYARLVDEVGDAYAGDRLAALDWLEAELKAALSSGAGARHPLVAAAAASVRELRADPRPLFDLIEANRQDQLVAAYPTFEDLLGYCHLSANPVGRLVLAAFGASTPLNERWSDRICTGLQLVEHLQDIAEDAAVGRVYLPEEDLARFGVRRAELLGPPPASSGLRGLIAFEAARARRLLERGSPLARSLGGWKGWATAGFVAGGLAALDALAERGFDPLEGAPRPGARQTGARLLRLLLEERAKGRRR